MLLFFSARYASGCFNVSYSIYVMLMDMFKIIPQFDPAASEKFLDYKYTVDIFRLYYCTMYLTSIFVKETILQDLFHVLYQSNLSRLSGPTH